MLTKRALLSAIAAAGFGMSAVEPASAQSYPTKTIKIVYPYPPGGTSEAVVRLVASRLQSALGQPVIIENRPGGAGGTVGVKSVVTADPDGYTLLWSSPGPLVVASAVYKNVGYDPVKNFTPIATPFSSPQILVVNPAVPAKSIQELVALAKAKPGMINFASPGYATQPHLLGEMFRLMAGINIVHVPYKGAAQAVTDLMAGQVQMLFETIPLLLPHIESGKLSALAIADEARNPQLPHVPTTSESGFQSLRATYWAGVLAPAGTPATIANKLNVTINEIMTSKELAVSLANLGAQPKIGSPQDFAAFMAAETQKWAAVVNAANIRAD